ncbi:MAG: DUF4040 domain-containing protein [Pararhodobacter sp.]|nr:DUF4040 domain-containing protein [Pararhodobacter sp.]
MAVFDLALCTLILLAALAAVAGPGLFRAVVFFVVYGVLIALAWVRLGAPDVALAEAAIGAGLTGVLLLGAVGRLSRAGADEPLTSRIDWPVALAAGLVGAMLVWAVLSLAPGPGLAPAVAEILPQTGVENPVTAVLLNLRAWDTLLESVVLLAALIGLWPLARGGAWQAAAGPVHHALPDGVLAGFGRLLPPVALLVGVYLVWAGAYQPGGAFQGGTVLAAAGVLCVMAGLVRAPGMAAPLWRLALVAGPGLFLALGVAGMAFGGFLLFPTALAKGMILAIEMVLTLSIAVTLALMVLGPPEGGGAQ